MPQRCKDQENIETMLQKRKIFLLELSGYLVEKILKIKRFSNHIKIT